MIYLHYQQCKTLLINMKRKIYEELVKWKDKHDRLPLIVRGARQVGKSYSIEQFGREAFSECVTINFELEPSFITRPSADYQILRA